MAIKLIGISGKKRSGKDEACSALLSVLPCGIRLAFADPLKEEVAAACGVPVSAIEENKSVFRTALQWWGTEFRRQFSGNDNYWIDRMAAQVEAAEAAGKRFAIITDVRFPNEYDFVINSGGLMIRIESVRRCAGGDADLHASETALDYHTFDTIIRNDGALSAFRSKVIEVAKLICPHVPSPGHSYGAPRFCTHCGEILETA